MGNQFAGDWNTTWNNVKGGTTKMHINDNGTGNYDFQAGRLVGEFKNSNSVYEGYWSQDGNQAVGTFKFTLAANGTWSGDFTYTHPRGSGGPWSGNRA